MMEVYSLICLEGSVPAVYGVVKPEPLPDHLTGSRADRAPVRRPAC
jgi:hypothetical protein